MFDGVKVFEAATSYLRGTMSNQALSVVVSLGDTAIFVADEAGRVLAPPGAEDRAGIAAVLAQAAARLAMMPPTEPTEPFHDTVAALAGNLERVGTDDAASLGRELADRLTEVADLMRAGNALVMQSAIAIGQRAMGATEH
jgi:hypothetical protein